MEKGIKEFALKSKVSIHTVTDDPVKLFYIQYVTIIAQLFGLSSKPAETLAEVLYQNYKFRNIVTEAKYRWITVFDVENRRVMQDNLGIGDRNFSNFLTVLRKKDILKGIEVAERFVVYPLVEENEVSFKLSFNFNISK